MTTHRKFLGSIVLSLLFLFSVSLLAQDGPRSSLKATANQTIGTDTEITIVYSRPGVKGREIWGSLVPWGLSTGRNGNKFPWRVGANENTTIEISKDVLI